MVRGTRLNSPIPRLRTIIITISPYTHINAFGTNSPYLALKSSFIFVLCPRYAPRYALVSLSGFFQVLSDKTIYLFLALQHLMVF